MRLNKEKFRNNQIVDNAKSEKIADLVTGLIIGIAGLDEIGCAAMSLWVVTNREAWTKSERIVWRNGELVIMAIGLLCVGYWSYNEIPNDTSGLRISELLKSGVLTLYGLTLLRLKQNRMRKKIFSVALGLLLFGAISLIGSLLSQPFGEARGEFYNVYSGNIDARSIYIGYTCTYATLILFSLKSRVAWGASLICLIFSLHSENRNCLITSTVVMCWLIGYAIKEYLRRRAGKSRIQFKYAGIIIPIAAISAIIIYAFNSELLTRMYNLAIDPRPRMYLSGFFLIGKGLIQGNFDQLADVNRGVLMVFPGTNIHEPGWHNLIIDSTKACGIIGLLLSSGWFLGTMIYSLQHLLKENYREAISGSLLILALFVVMPIAIGGHELLGSVALTLIIVGSLEKQYDRVVYW